MTVVIGTAGHIDHGKTTLLRALTGIDADRLPEERRRGMTIDVGYAHLALDDGRVIDFVDVPGHDKLVGNMLVGAGEIDAALLVIAADDGPRAQTLEHLALLDALGVIHGVAVITKTDAVEPDRVGEVTRAVAGLLATTSLAGSPAVAVSSVSGVGLDDVRAALANLASTTAGGAGRGSAAPPRRPSTLAIDRAFAVKGRGAVVTGTLRGGPLAVGDTLRLVPGDRDVRVREIQVHGSAVGAVGAVDGGGRTALNLAGIGADELHRGDVLTADPDVHATDRALVTFRRPIADRARARLHAGTAAIDAEVGRAGRDALDLGDGTTAGIVRLMAPIALAAGDRYVLRRGPGREPVGGIVLDAAPARGISRRRQTSERVGRLAATLSGTERADRTESRAARLDLHGASAGALAPDVRVAAADAALAVVRSEATLAAVRDAVTRTLRRGVTIQRDAAVVAAAMLVDELVEAGRLVREADRIRLPGTSSPSTTVPDLEMVAAMDRLERALAVPAPPSLAEAARQAGAPTGAIKALERSGRIVVLEPDIGYASATYQDLVGEALAIAANQPLTPAAFRDATGTSRKYVMAILEDLDRRAILRRTPAGHVPGPKAPPPGVAPAARTTAVTGR